MLRSLSFLAIFCCGLTLHADTIIKFDLGSAGVDFHLAGGTLSTLDDGDGLTLGDQNTNINFTGFLSSITDIPTDIASFSLDGVALSGPATIVAGASFVQPTSGGEFKLWDDLNQLLLSGTLTDGVVNGALGLAATGSFFNINLDTFTGGSLATLLDPNSLALAISFTDVNDGLSFSVSNSLLDDFEAAGTANIAAAVPEPNTGILAMLATLALALRCRRGQ